MSTIHLPLDEWIENVAAAALSSMETVKATFDLARNAIERGIPGDFVECGVFGGVQCAMMARAIYNEHSEYYREMGCFPSGHHRRVHLFDCFAGIPPIGPHDTDILDPETFNKHTTCSMKDVQANMRQWGIPDELLVYHPGLFAETLPALEPFPIAMLRLDGDLYESTKDPIKYLLPHVNPGGWVVVDDWGLSGARKAAEEMVNHRGPLYWQKQPI